jgi:hypothetical protein
MHGTRKGAPGSGSTRSRRSIAASGGGSSGWYSLGRSFTSRSSSRTGSERELMRH